MKKQLIYFFIFGCLLMPSVAMADFYLDLSRPDDPFKVSPLESVTFTLEVQKDGIPVSGESVTFSVSPDDGIASLSTTSATTDSNGQAQTTLSLSDDSSESHYQVTAKLTKGQGNVPAEWVPVGVVSDGAKLELYINHLRTYNPGESVGFTFSLRKKDGTGVQGKTVTFSLSPDNGTASLSTTSTTTDSNGGAQTTVVLGSNASGSYTVTATLDDGKSVSNSTGTVHNLTLQPPDVTLDMLIPSGAIPLKPGDSRTFIAIAQKDGNYVSGKTVTFSVSPNDGTVSLSPTTATTGSDGRASTSLTTGSGSSGSYKVTAALDNGHSISGTVTVESSSPPPNDDKGKALSLSPSDDQGTNTGTTSVPTPDNSGENTLPPKSSTGHPNPQPEPNYTIIPFDYEKEGVGKVVFSELMLARLNRNPQWIELYNTTNQDIDVKGWKIVGRYLDDSNTMNILETQVISKSLTIKGKETVLIVSYAIPNSRDRISIGLADKADALGSNSKNFWNYDGIVLELQDTEGNPIDRIGNLNEKNEIVWEIPMVVRDKRISLIRRLKSIRSQEYDFTIGTSKFGWFPADKVERLAAGSSQYYYGKRTDVGSPGYRTEDGESLPVTLSSFNPRINQDGSVVISWITESEIDNAGFHIFRSEKQQGPFIRVNPKLIQGAGTTGERNEYMWADITAKPNIAYYYQIEDVSFAGIKQTLVTKRMKGIFTVKNRLLTHWGNLKTRP